MKIVAKTKIQERSSQDKNKKIQKSDDNVT
jgi:hypothetical protein